IGARSIDAGEARNLREANVRMYEADDVERRGIKATMSDAIAYLVSHDVRAIHLSLDLDVLDPSLYPGVSTPASGGLTASEIMLACKTVGEKMPIVSMDLAEYTPSEDIDGVTAGAGITAM